MIRAEARRILDVPLLATAVACAALAVILESQLRLPVRLPGHRAFPGALVLLLLAETTPAAVLLGFAAVIGGGIALLAGTPLIAVAWLAPAALIVVSRGRQWSGRMWFAIAIGLLFGALRYSSLPDELHPTTDMVRLGGHLTFGTLGALAAFAALSTRKDRSRTGALPG